MITADEYQQQCAKFDNHNPRFAQHALVMGLCAEAGEVANAYERSLRKTAKPFDFENLKLELGDVLWGVARLAAEHGWTMSEVMQANIDKLTARYAARDCSCLLDTGREPVGGEHWEACNSWRWYHPEFNMTGGEG